MSTDRYKSLLTLNAKQLEALEVLDRGGTHVEAAEAAQVDRTTVSRDRVPRSGVVRRRRDPRREVSLSG